MPDIQIRNAAYTDAEDVINLLEGFYPGIPNHWRKLFAPRALIASDDDYPGLVLLVDKKIVGFMGLIFSEQMLPQKGRVKFCNLTTWYVSPAYRQHGLSLLLETLKIPGVTFTNFTSSPKPYALLQRLGFKPCQEDQTRILPIPSLSRRKVKIFIDHDKSILPEHLHSIYDAHQNLTCHHLVIKENINICYCLIVKTKYKKIPLAKIYYASDVTFLNNIIKTITTKLCWILKVGYLIVEGELGDELQGFGVRQQKLFPPRLYKSDQLTQSEINLLGSEVFVLGI